MSHLNEAVLFGAAYYHEYQPSPRLEEDMRLMREAGFSVIRVGESVWSTWEPDDGQFDLEWLAPVLDAAHQNGIKVILGTPTYAAPPWLVRQLPEINVELPNGKKMGWGARQEINYAHPAFLFYAERIIRKIIARYAAHPAVVGFQVDNEPGMVEFANDQVFQRFVNHLRHQYGSVEKLNKEWGLTYWSHLLGDWADLWRPGGNAQPQYSLAWRRFQAQLTTSFISWQADIAREYKRDDQFVTTCIAYDRVTADDEALSRDLDVTSGNAYFRMQDELGLPRVHDTEQNWTLAGTWALFGLADRMYGTKQAPFLVTETNAQAIGQQWVNKPGFDGQWRQAAWALVSRGANMIEYWHWHTLHAGAETYWGGILPHSQKPGRIYEQLADIGSDFRAAGDRVTQLTPAVDVGVLFDNPSKWAQSEQPFLGEGMVSDTRTHHTVRDAFVRGTFEAGLQGATVHAAQLRDMLPRDAAARFPVLVAAAFTIATDDDLIWLRDYAAAGGHLVVGIRTGYEDEEARARLETKPAFLDEAAGAWYDEFSNLSAPIPVESTGFTVPEGAAAMLWADGLQSTDADVLLSYDHPHFGRWPAATTRAHGDGRVTLVGTVPNPALARALMDWAVGVVDHTPGWRPQADSQSVANSTNQRGETIHVVHNWSWDANSYELPDAATDVLTGETLAAGSTIKLGSWDVRVLAS